VATAVGYRVIDASGAIPRPRRVPQLIARAERTASLR